MNEDKKTVKVPVVEEGVIRKEDIVDGEGLMLAIKLLMSWAQESKKKGWGKNEKWPVAIFVANADPGDFHRRMLKPEEPAKVRMQMLGFVNAFTAGDLLGDGKTPGLAYDMARAFVRTAIQQNNQSNEPIQKAK